MKLPFGFSGISFILSQVVMVVAVITLGREAWRLMEGGNEAGAIGMVLIGLIVVMISGFFTGNFLAYRKHRRDVQREIAEMEAEYQRRRKGGPN